MSRSTVDFGIDLGTTNSAIALLRGTEIEVFRNEDNVEYTPSAVWIDGKNQQYVGRRAKERLEDDADNAFCEFKRQMGRMYEYRFARSGRVAKPEELSSEVLKSLKADVRMRLSEEVRAAVITVPAAFELPECKATMQAAQLAGLRLSPLLQEPVAAALAYGFEKSDSDRVFWLVYDFGGGTFDAAVIHACDGIIEVVNHGGDNLLGGKNIDWAIVEQLLVPAIAKQAHLADFRRGNPRWRAAFAKLKWQAEVAKIRTSRHASAPITVEFADDQGAPVHFEYDLTRADVERLAEPFIVRSINICRQVLADARLEGGHVEKVLLVGGPSLMPHLREQLMDQKSGLGIPLEHSIDPMTIVARGAAVFAGTQRMPQDVAAVPRPGVFTIAFPDWKFVGSDLEPLAAGMVKAPSTQSLDRFTVEFTNNEMRPAWRSGKLKLAANGGFMTTLRAEKGRANTFRVELCDQTGQPQPMTTDPLPLSYTVGMVIENQPLIHSIGVALATNEMEWLLMKGSQLPARRRRCVLKTAMELRPGQSDGVIRIPVREGESKRADRNRLVGNLEIHAHQINRNVPIGSDVEFTIEIDESRQIRAKAYIPILDNEYEEVMHVGEVTAPNIDNLKSEVEREKKRLEDLREQSLVVSDPQIQQALQRIEQERTVGEIEDSLNAAEGDADAASMAEKRQRDLKDALDRVEDALEWPILTTKTGALKAAAREILQQHGTADDRTQLPRYEADIDSAIRAHNPELLQQRLDELRTWGLRILNREGVLQIIRFQQLEDLRNQMRDQAQANLLIAQGHRAISNNDRTGIEAVNNQLANLLPTPPPLPDWSTVHRG